MRLTVIIKKESEKSLAMVNLASGQTTMVSWDCAATVGKVSDIDHLNRDFS